MALSLPAFIGAALASMAMGAAGGSAKRQLQVDKEGREAVLSLLQKGVTDKVLGGVDIPDELGKQAYGSNWKNLKPYINEWSAAMRGRHSQQQALISGMMSAGDEGDAAAAPAQAMGPGAQPAPSMESQTIGAISQPGAPPPVGGPQMPQSLGAAPGGPAQPSGALAPPSQPLAPAPAPTPSAAPVLPQVNREVQSLLRGVKPLGAARSATINTDMGITLSVNMEEKARNRIWSNAIQSNASPKALQAAWAAAGVPYSKDTLDGYARTHYGTNIGTYQRAVAGRGPLTPEMAKQASMAYMVDHGWAPPGEVQSLFPDQKAMDAWLGNFIQQNADIPADRIAALANQFGVVASPEAIAQFRSQQRGAVETQLRSQFPRLAANPNAMAAALRNRLGASALSAAELAAADSDASIDPKVKAEMAAAGIAAPLARDLTPAGAASGVSAVASARSAVETREATQSGRVAEQGAAGRGRGEETARAGQTIPPKELHQFVNPTDLSVPKPGTKFGEVEGKPDSQFQVFLDTPQVLNSIGRMRRVQKTYDQSVETLRPLLEKGSLSVFATKMGITGTAFGIPGTPIKFQIPAGIKSDARTMAALKKEFPQFTDDQIDKFARQIVALDVAGKEALSILRSPVFDEKGNIRGDIVEAGSRALPSLNDNYLTASQKAREFNKARTAMEEAVGIRMRVPVTAPDGTPGTWNLEKGPIPHGYKRRE